MQKKLLFLFGRQTNNFIEKVNIRRPAYFVVKITNTGFNSTCNNCTLIKQEGGLKFYKRDAVMKNKLIFVIRKEISYCYNFGFPGF